MVEEVVHGREDVGIVAGGAAHEARITERILDDFGQIVAREVADNHLGRTLRAEHFGHLLGRSLRAAVNAGISYQNTLVFSLVARPDVVQAQGFGQILAPEHRTVQRAYGIDLERSGLLEHILHLHAVFAADVEVVTARLAGPIGQSAVGVVFLLADGAEFAESVGGEEHMLLAFVAHHHLGPMHHRCCHEMQRVVAKLQSITLFHQKQTALKTGAVEEVGQHLGGCGGAHERHLGIKAHHLTDESGVVGLHVVADEIVGLTACKGFRKLTLPLRSHTGVGRIHHGDLVVEDDVAVVTHAFGHHILALEEVDVEIVGTDIADFA